MRISAHYLSYLIRELYEEYDYLADNASAKEFPRSVNQYPPFDPGLLQVIFRRENFKSIRLNGSSLSK